MAVCSRGNALIYCNMLIDADCWSTHLPIRQLASVAVERSKPPHSVMGNAHIQRGRSLVQDARGEPQQPRIVANISERGAPVSAGKSSELKKGDGRRVTPDRVVKLQVGVCGSEWE
jgi:hypothetical protein